MVITITLFSIVGIMVLTLIGYVVWDCVEEHRYQKRRDASFKANAMRCNGIINRRIARSSNG